MVGGAGVGGNEKKYVKSSETSQEESCVNYFASVLLGEVPEAGNDIF